MFDELKDELPLYDLLRRVFLKEPSEELLRLLRDMPFEERDNSDGVSLMVAEVRACPGNLRQCADRLATEYTKLFLGPVRIPVVPFASFYLSETGQLMTDETIDVRKRYLEAGMKVQQIYSVPDDHIGIELEFLFFLTGKILELHDAGQDAEASRFYELRQSFLREHCMLWFPSFSGRILASTENAFFRGAAVLLRECVA